MVKTLAVIVASSAFAMSAFAAPKQMTNEMLDQVVAGSTGDTCCDTCTLKGNNGWGNGADGTNPGSDNGGTAASKLAGTNQSGLDKINTNPTTSTGR
jgi:hypothetical protein